MQHVGGRAVVLGASMGGLLAARVLTETFERVTLVDRDDLSAGAVPRRGVPQGRHPHGLLARGREIMEELLPGLTEDLVAHGALGGDVQGDVRWYNDGHLLRQAHTGMQGIALSRPLLEDRVRARVLGLPGVELVAPADVVELTARSDRVTGVRVRRRDDGSAVADLAADLVVDATGRGSHTPVWLTELGYPRPEETAVDVGLGYTTWTVPRRATDLGGDVALIIGATVAAPRFGAAIAMEGERWMLMAGGYREDHAPQDFDGFRQFAASLPAPDLGRLVADKEPLDGARPYRFRSSVRRHYERLTRFPDGLLVFGDALSSFNPVYGQGMTVAALEALALRETLAEGTPALAARFFRRAARLIDVPWDIAAGSDLRLPAVPGPRPPRVRAVNSYVARVQAAAATDATVGLAFLRVANLLDRPEALLRPSIAVRVGAARLAAARSRRRLPAGARAVGPAAVPRPRSASEPELPSSLTGGGSARQAARRPERSCPRSGSNRHWNPFKGPASADWATGAALDSAEPVGRGRLSRPGGRLPRPPQPRTAPQAGAPTGRPAWCWPPARTRGGGPAAGRGR